MKEIRVLYKLGENGLLPTQGYEDDYAMDVYAAKGVLVPPLTFRSIIIPTDLHTAFDPSFGMKVSLRSGIASKTPLIMPNAPAIIEGSYRGNIGVIVRNSFIDNRPVDYVLDVKGNKVPLEKVPAPVKKAARQFFEEELELLGYENSKSPYFKEMFKTKVPCGTVYIRKHERIAQIHFQEKIFVKFVKEDNLPKSTRGEGGFGSSGVEAKK